MQIHCVGPDMNYRRAINILLSAVICIIPQCYKVAGLEKYTLCNQLYTAQYLAAYQTINFPLYVNRSAESEWMKKKFLNFLNFARGQSNPICSQNTVWSKLKTRFWSVYHYYPRRINFQMGVFINPKVGIIYARRSSFTRVQLFARKLYKRSSWRVNCEIYSGSSFDVMFISSAENKN